MAFRLTVRSCIRGSAEIDDLLGSDLSGAAWRQHWRQADVGEAGLTPALLSTVA